MVTQLKQSKNAASISTKEDVANASADFKAANIKVESAIKARNESMTTLQEGAAAAVYFFAKHGQVALINKLFNGLPVIDANAFRAQFIARLVDIFGEGGVRDETDDSKWVIRPTPFLQFASKPEKAGEHWRKAKSNDENATKRINNSLAAIVKAGEEGLAAID